MVVDAADPDSRSAGSFFTNPLVDAATAARTGGPQWPQPDGRTKLILKDPSSGDYTDRIVAGS